MPRPLPLVLLLGLVLRATGAQALAPVEFWSAWESLERVPPAFATADVRRVTDLAGRLLTGRGVLWHAAPDDEDVLVIAPVRTGGTLNGFAWRLARELSGLAVVFDARRLKEEDAGALYDDATHRLLLSAQEIAAGRVSDYVEHELVHARNLVALTRGVDNLYMGWIRRAALGPDLHPVYPDRFSLDELQAYAQQARANLRELASPDGHGDREGTVEMIDTGAQLARVAAEVGGRASRQVASLAGQRPLPAAVREERIVDGTAVTARVIGPPGARVRFERGALPDWASRPGPVTHAVVEMDGAELEFTLPFDVGRHVTRRDLRLVQERAARLAACARAIERGFADLRARLDAADLDGAAVVARALDAPALPWPARASCP